MSDPTSSKMSQIYGDLDRMIGMDSALENTAPNHTDPAYGDSSAVAGAAASDPKPINGSVNHIAHIGQQQASNIDQIDPNAPKDWGETIESELDFFLA